MGPWMSRVMAWSFPVGDWQFWVASALFLMAAGYLLKGVIPVPWLSARAKRQKAQRRVRLTVRRDGV